MSGLQEVTMGDDNDDDYSEEEASLDKNKSQKSSQESKHIHLTIY